MKTYTSYQNDIPRIINNSLADNLTWATEMVNDSIRYLVTKYFFNERSYTTVTVAQQQFYNLPPQVKKLINVTVTIGSVVWQPKECPTREFWDSLNVTTFYQDFPSYFFVYNGQVGIWPSPSSAGNTITMNYKTRIGDLSMVDVTDTSSGALISITNGATAMAASTTTGPFSQWQTNNWIRIPYSTTATPGKNGDNQWYQIDTVRSGSVTGAVLKNPYSGATVTGVGFTIGEVPILPEDYQDLPLYRMGYIYYTTRFPDATKAQLYEKLWNDGVKALDDEFGSKTVSVILQDTDQQIVNPNLFVRSVS